MDTRPEEIALRSRSTIVPAAAALIALAGAPAAQLIGDLDPRTYSSPSGEYALFVDPSQRTGAGEGRYRFIRAGEEQWSGARPWTLREAEVTDDGLVGGYAYGAGVSGGEGDSLTIVLLEANGEARLEERRKREGVRSCMTSPEPMVKGIFLDADNDRMVVRFQPESVLRFPFDPDDWKLGEYWSTYALSSCTAGPRLRPKASLGEDERLGPISAARALPGTGLVLVHWTWYDHDALGSVFTLHDEDGELRWRLDWRTEVSGKDCCSPQSVLWQELRLRGAILEVEAPGRFTLGHAAQLERVTFEARHIEGAREGLEVREVARAPFEELPKTGPKALAPSPRSEPDPQLGPQHLGTIVLGEASALTPIHDVIEFGVDGRGRLGVLCGTYLRREFLLVEADGSVLGILELPSVPGGAMFDMACVGGERWIVIVRPVTAGVRISGYWVEPEAGRLVPIEGFDGTCTPELMSLDSEGDPLPCRISGSPDPQDPSNLSGMRALTLTSDGRVAVLNPFPARVQYFSRDGQFLHAVVLKESWGREPRYPLGIRPDLDGGVIVHDFDGQPPVVRMDREGGVTASFQPRFADGNSFRLRGGVQLAPDGTLWTSDGHALLALDDAGVVQRVLGSAPDAEILGRVARLVVGPEDRLYTADRRTGSVHVFDAGGKRLLVCKSAPEDFPDELTSAWLTVTDSGEVFLGDIDASGVVHFAADGTRRGVERPELERGSLEWYAQPGTGWMWVVGHATLYLLDVDLRRFRTIERMPDGVWLRNLGAAAVAPDGSIALLAGRGTDTRVLVYSPTGEPLRSIGLTPSDADQAPFAFDGHRLVFRSLKLLDLDTRRVQHLVLERSGVHWTPAFAAGGNELWLFDGERRVERYRLD